MALGYSITELEGVVNRLGDIVRRDQTELKASIDRIIAIEAHLAGLADTSEVKLANGNAQDNPDGLKAYLAANPNSDLAQQLTGKVKGYAADFVAARTIATALKTAIEDVING